MIVVIPDEIMQATNIANPSIQACSLWSDVIISTIMETIDATRRIFKVKSSIAPKNISQRDSNFG